MCLWTLQEKKCGTIATKKFKSLHLPNDCKKMTNKVEIRPHAHDNNLSDTENNYSDFLQEHFRSIKRKKLIIRSISNDTLAHLFLMCGKLIEVFDLYTRL